MRNRLVFSRAISWVLCLMWIGVTASASLRAIGSEGDDHCPRLPKNSGYMWEWEVHIDADSCNGVDTKNKTFAFGLGTLTLYGPAPPGTFEPERSFVQSGTVGGRAVRWYKISDYHGPRKLAYKSLTLEDSENQRYLSVVVYADSPAQMRQRLGILARMRFRW